MCGVAGFIDRSLWDVEAEIAIRQMSAAIKNRGPDGEGYYIDGENGVALAHRRLAIIDVTSAGSQPMTSICGRYVISFNGEIYNFPLMRTCVEASRGRVNWRGHSDTEVLVEAIAEFGLHEALKMTTGMFALALWDKVEKEIYLARDRFGEKPLYYFEDGPSIAFSSELFSISKFPRFRASIDTDAVGAFLQYGFVPGELTLFESVKKVLPGHYVKFSASSSTKLVSHCYWNLTKEVCDQSEVNLPLEDVVDKLEVVLTDAIEGQLVADVGLGAFLSSGIDSSLITSIIRRRLDRPLTTFSMGFDDERYDESAVSRVIAKSLGSSHHEHLINKSEILQTVQSVAEIFDEPIGDTSVLPTYLVCKVAKKHVTVALSGDGGDEMFGGYNHYRWGGRALRNLTRIPKFARSWVGASMTKVGAGAGVRSIVKLGQLIRESEHSNPNLLLNGGILNARDGVSMRGSEDWIKVEDLGNRSIEHRLMAIDLYGFLPNDILCKVDRASMGVSLETRAPFLDRHVAQFAWSIPSKFTVGGPTSKYVLRKLLSRYLPQEIVSRPKKGFGIPLDVWFREELKSFVDNKLGVLKSKYAHLVSPAFVDTYWSAHLSGRFNWQREVWTLVALVLFLETYF